MALTLDVLADGLTYLVAADDILRSLANHLSGFQRLTIDKMDFLRSSVNAINDKAVAVFLQSATLLIEVEAVTDDFRLLSHRATLAHHVVVDACLWVAGRDENLFEIDIAVGGCRAFLLHTDHLNLLHQVLVIGIHSIETIHHVGDVILAVGGTIEELEERIEQLQALACLVRLVGTEHALRLVDDHDGVRGGEDVDRTARAEFITTGEDDTGGGISGTSFLVLVLVERGVEGLCVDNHHVYAGIGGERIYLGKLL